MSLAAEFGENHLRSLSITLQLIDKTLCEWDRWAEGQLSSGVMYFERDSLSDTQKAKLKNGIVRIRKILVLLRDDLALKPSVVHTSRPMVGRSALLWETALEATSTALRGYGQVSPRIAEYLDPIVEKLASEIQEISRIFSQPSH